VAFGLDSPTLTRIVCSGNKLFTFFPNLYHLSFQFPNGFQWGTATSAYQIEGATATDGRGESIWDRFASRPGAIEDGSDASTACDHYRLWQQDLDLLAELGMGAYRFSVAWPRVLPEGRGRTNEAGLDFYEGLVDGLLARGITPWLTLYHWDLPQALEDAGGWPARTTVDAYLEYVDVVSRRLGDRVGHWITQNEPWIIANLGYDSGVHAPGRRDLADSLAAAHHVLLGHGRAVPILHANAPGSRVGITLNLVPGHAASNAPDDVAAAHLFDGFFNRWYLDALYRGTYPDDVVDHYRARLDGADPLAAVRPGDLDTIRTPTDFLGINYYSRAVLRGERDADGPLKVDGVPPGEGATDMGWEVYPEGLEELLLRVRDDYAPPSIVITENGAAYAVGPDEDGEIVDDLRVAYLSAHLRACHRAIEAGVPLHGYFVWSLLDNFEWSHGYVMRFGLTWVDYGTQKRVPKKSAYWYRDVVGRNGLVRVVEER
jgi:beta-glucosidase